MALTQKPRRPTDTDGMQVGLAWLILTNDKRPICWHNGGTGGYHSFIAFQEAAKTGIVVLTNGVQDVDDIGLHFLLPSVPLGDYSAPARRMAKPVAVALLPGEKLPMGEALFDRAIQQLGGRAAMAKIQSRRIEAEIEMAVLGVGVKGPMITYRVRPDQEYTKTEVLGLISAEEGSNGAIAWEVNSMEGARVVAGREKEIKRIADPFDLAIGKELYRKFKCEGKFQVEGQTCYKVVGLSRDYAIPVTWYFAADSGWPLGKEYTFERGGKKMFVEERQGDFRPVDKVLYPFETRQLVEGEGATIDTRVKRIELNVSIPAGRFDPPEAVKKLRTGDLQEPASSAK
jgi:hypothetical protein